MFEKHILTISEVEGMLDCQRQDRLEKSFPDRCRRSQKFLHREDALRCLGAGLLMKSVLGIAEKDIVYGRFGKPHTTGGEAFFNISHSGDYIVLVKAGNPIGVDVEKRDPRHTDLADRVFAEDELQWLREASGCEYTDRFYILWTMKESLMKATGQGLNLTPDSFSVMDGIRKGKLVHEGIRYEMHSEILGDCRLSICEQVHEKHEGKICRV